MKKKAVVLAVLSVMLISTTVFAGNEHTGKSTTINGTNTITSGYVGQNITLNGTDSAASDIGINSTEEVRVDINSISDSEDCNKVKVIIMNTDTGKITQQEVMRNQTTKFFKVDKGNIKVVFKRCGSDDGTMKIGYNFVYKINACRH